jgi:2'-5' RNA ligase
MNERPATQRLFFALWPDAAVRRQIQACLQVLPKTDGRTIREADLHITLVFLGARRAEERERAEHIADRITVEPFEMQLDTLGFWPKPQVIWLGMRTVPGALRALAACLAEDLRGAGFELDTRPFAPHMTIRRKVRKAPAQATFDAVRWAASSFALVESRTLPTGAEYHVLRHWPGR